MKYIFFARRFSDVDHIVPVIYSFLINNVDPKNIKYYDLIHEFSLLNIQADKRIQFLRSKKIFFNQFILVKILIPIFYLSKHNFKIKIISRIFKKLYNMINNRLLYLYIIRLKFIFFKKEKRTIFVDENIDGIYSVLLGIAKSKKHKIIGIPHGSFLHYGCKNEKEERLYFPQKFAKKEMIKNITEEYYYDLSVSYNDLHRTFQPIHQKKTIILSSPRYSKEWNQIQKSLFSKIPKIYDKSKINLLFFEEKLLFGVGNNEFLLGFHRNKLYSIINFLSKQEDIQLIIKRHPSKKSKDFDNIANIYYADDNYSSYELILFADLIIGNVTSALFDVFLCKKRIIIPCYCSSFKTVMIKYNPEVVAHDFLEFKNKYYDQIKKIKIGQNEKNYDYFYKDFIARGKKNILSNFHNDLIKELDS